MIETCYELARAANLSGWELLADADCVRKECNGIGPAWFPWWAREVLSRLLPSLNVVAYIHDRRYSIGGAPRDRLSADVEFYYNGCLMADYKYGRFNPLRYLVRWTARHMYRLLEVGGGPAFNYKEI